MPKPEETQVIVELTQYSLRALRATGTTVEVAGECLLENKQGLEALLDSVSPARKTSGLVAAASVWPGSATWHVSTDTEAMLDRTGDSLRAIAAAAQEDGTSALYYAVCNATDGKAVTPDGMDKWILASCPKESQSKAVAALKDLNAVTDGAAPAAFASVGAISAALRLEGKDGAVVLWDIGSERSSLILVTARGAEAAAPCAVGMEKIFEAVQQALKLKFRGAGARLFFNEGYDFSEPGPKVGATVGASLQEALGQLPTLHSPPALACLGLTAKQGWFTREAAKAAGISSWEPDLGLLAAEFGFKFSDAAVLASLSPASAGILGLLSARSGAREDWLPEWVETEALPQEAPQEPEPAEPEPQPEPEPVRQAPARPAAPVGRPKPSLSGETPGPMVTFSTKPSAKPPVAAKSVTAPPIPAPSSSTRPPVPVAQARPASTPASSSPPPTFPAPTPAGGRQPSFSNPSFPAPGGSSHEPPAPARPPSFSNPGFPMPEGSPRPAPAPVPPSATPATAVAAPAGGTASPTATPAVTALPFEAVKMLKPLPPGMKAAAAPPVAKEPPKSRVGFYVTVGVVASLVFAAIAVVLEARMEKIKAYDLEQQEATAHHIAEAQLKQAEQDKIAAAEQSRKDMEAAVEVANKQAEEETRKRVLAEVEIERLSKLPGILVIATVPAGASVSIDGAAPIKSPVRAEGIAPGSHRVQITLAGHESADLSAEIRGSKTTDLGTVTLGSIFGSVELSSSPDNLEFAIRPADDPAGKSVRSGRTPAAFDDIPHGAYVVTFSRPGCKDHTEKISVEKGSKSSVQTKYLDGGLELTSDPSGANVSKDGSFLGTTPLSLHDLTPKLASFDLTLPGYDPTPISCQIPEGDTLKYEARLLRKDRVFNVGEAKTPPESYEAPAPSLSAAQRKMGADVLLSAVVRRDGTVTAVEVVRSTDDDIARRCRGAVERWKFHPATGPDDRDVESRVEIPFKFPAGGP